MALCKHDVQAGPVAEELMGQLLTLYTPAACEHIKVSGSSSAESPFRTLIQLIGSPTSKTILPLKQRALAIATVNPGLFATFPTTDQNSLIVVKCSSFFSDEVCLFRSVQISSRIEGQV